MKKTEERFAWSPESQRIRGGGSTRLKNEFQERREILDSRTHTPPVWSASGRFSRARTLA